MSKHVQTGWRICIDYRKLNVVTNKDHLSLPFVDQMLDRLARKPHFYFLNGFSGYNQIPIAADDQENDNIHMSIWDVCILARLVQRRRHIPGIGNEYFFRYNWNVY